MDRGYFDDNEKQDMLLLRKLSTDVGMFATVGECEKYACADASGITKEGKVAIVELRIVTMRYRISETSSLNPRRLLISCLST